MQDTPSQQVYVIIVMGVSGVGKSTVGRLLAERLGWTFHDADAYHPAANIRKMRSGIPLTDADRQAWLVALRALIVTCVREKRPAVLACSALKEAYRRQLKEEDAEVLFAYLQASPELVQVRLSERTGHFMNPELLESQFETLEEPEDALVVDAAQPPEAIAADIQAALAKRPGPEAA